MNKIVGSDKDKKNYLGERNGKPVYGIQRSGTWTPSGGSKGTSDYLSSFFKGGGGSKPNTAHRGGTKKPSAGSNVFYEKMEKERDRRRKSVNTGSGSARPSARTASYRGLAVNLHQGAGGGSGGSSRSRTAGIIPAMPTIEAAPVYEVPKYDTEKVKAEARAMAQRIIAPFLRELQDSLTGTNFANTPEGQMDRTAALKNYGSAISSVLSQAMPAAQASAESSYANEYDQLVSQARSDFESAYADWEQRKSQAESEYGMLYNLWASGDKRAFRQALGARRYA